MRSPFGEHVTVRVRFVPEPSVLAWCWELVDQATERVLESSWSDDWTAFDTKELALAAGRRRRAGLGPRRLVIVAADEPELHAWLVRKFAREADVEVIRDRRRCERRVRPTGLLNERRHSERRRFSDADAEMHARGWTVISLLAQAA